MPNKHPDWTFLALLEELLKILTQFWHSSSLINFFNEGDWFHSFPSYTCNTWKHLFSADWNEGLMSVPIIYSFYCFKCNTKRDNKQYHRKVLISSFQMNDYANFHFISGGDVFVWGSLGTGKQDTVPKIWHAGVNVVFYITGSSLSLFSWSCVVIMRRMLISATLCYLNWSRISSVSIAQAGDCGLNSQAGPILRVLK